MRTVRRSCKLNAEYLDHVIVLETFGVFCDKLNVPSDSHILLVDDEPAVRQMYKMYFSIQGFEITPVANAIDALHEIYNRKFDAIILDLGLGDTNGMDLIEPIKAGQPNAPVFILTGQTITEPMRKEAFARGAFQFFTKSHPLDYVVSELRRGIRMAGIAAAQKNSAA
jgi:DNA-binding NtrC family response regulator